MITQETWSVSNLIKYINNKFSSDAYLKNTMVKGEIVGLVKHSSGHWYFSLKDEKSSIHCAMFRGYNQSVNFLPKNGDEVVVRASANVFETRGELQLIVTEMQPYGIGNFLIQFERIKERMQEKGYLDEAHKRPLPPYPEKIAVVCGKTTHGLEDIRITVSKRWPVAQLVEFSAIVQGKEAVNSIRDALQRANQSDCDMIILARGGGSIEDLWCFNDESLAIDIYNSRLPVVTGIGHEPDITIADLVADLRAATPTAAAMKSVPDKVEVQAQISGYLNIIEQLMENRLNNSYQQLDYTNSVLDSYCLRIQALGSELNSYKNILRLSSEKMLDDFRNRASNSLQQAEKALSQRVSDHGNRITLLTNSLNNAVTHKLSLSENRYDALLQRLELVNPLNTLKRGYALGYQGGKLIKKIEEVDLNEDLTLRLQDGRIDCRPLRIEKGENHG